MKYIAAKIDQDNRDCMGEDLKKEIIHKIAEYSNEMYVFFPWSLRWLPIFFQNTNCRFNFGPIGFFCLLYK